MPLSSRARPGGASPRASGSSRHLALIQTRADAVAAAGTCRSSAVSAVAAAKQAGAAIIPWAGGGPDLPIVARLRARTTQVAYCRHGGRGHRRRWPVRAWLAVAGLAPGRPWLPSLCHAARRPCFSSPGPGGRGPLDAFCWARCRLLPPPLRRVAGGDSGCRWRWRGLNLPVCRPPWPTPGCPPPTRGNVQISCAFNYRDPLAYGILGPASFWAGSKRLVTPELWDHGFKIVSHP
jgi:hypothetical protein